MNQFLKKSALTLVAVTCAAGIAYAETKALTNQEHIEIDVTVTKDLGNTVDLLSKVSMRTEKDKPSLTSNRSTIKYRSALGRSKTVSLNSDRFSEISVGIDEVYIPASSSKSGTPDPAQMLVTIDDVSNWTKFLLPETQEAIELPGLTRKIINVPIHPGRTNIGKEGSYTVTVTERTVTK